MRGVMLDAMKFRANFFGSDFEGGGEFFVNAGETAHDAGAIESKARHAHGETEFGAEAGPGIARDGDVVHFGEFYAGLSRGNIGWRGRAILRHISRG